MEGEGQIRARGYGGEEKTADESTDAGRREAAEEGRAGDCGAEEEEGA